MVLGGVVQQRGDRLGEHSSCDCKDVTLVCRARPLKQKLLPRLHLSTGLQASLQTTPEDGLRPQAECQQTVTGVNGERNGKLGGPFPLQVPD